MQGNRGRGNPFFNMGDPFAGFGGFGGFGGQRSLMSSFFGGRDPFDDPFFTQPFGGMQSSFFGGHPFPNMHPFLNMRPPGFLEQQAPEPKRSKGPIIEELDSDDEKEATDKGKSENPRKHGRPGNPFVEDPDDAVEERKSKQLHKMNVYNEPSNSLLQPQSGSFSFQSSTVTYGGANGAYYTSSTTRRMGSDGVTFEESKEADTATRKATHRVSRGIHNKGHSLTRKLSSDGNVETMQTLHNLDEDELPVFEATWKGKNLPGCMGSSDGANRIEQRRQGSQGGWALPPAENPQHSARVTPDGKNKAATSTRTQPSGKMASDGKGRSGCYSQGRP